MVTLFYQEDAKNTQTKSTKMSPLYYYCLRVAGNYVSLCSVCICINK